jgi:hypothetical protein
MLTPRSQNLVLILVLTSLLTSGLEIKHASNAWAVPSQVQVQRSTDDLPQHIAKLILRNAANHAGLKIADVKITKTISKTFSNACVFKFGEVCSQQYEPIYGWVVNVKVKQRVWQYHVNKSYSQIILDPKISNTLTKS